MRGLAKQQEGSVFRSFVLPSVPRHRQHQAAAAAAGGPLIYSLFETGRTTKEGRGCCVLAKQSVHEPTSGRAHDFLDCLQKTARLLTSFVEAVFVELQAVLDQPHCQDAQGHIHAAICGEHTLLSGCCRDCACPTEEPALLPCSAWSKIHPAHSSSDIGQIGEGEGCNAQQTLTLQEAD
jgi:hypothetical protein